MNERTAPNQLTADLAAIGANLGGAIRRDRARALRRRRSVRTAALGVGVLAGLSGTALGAGQALGVIHLGGGVGAHRVTHVPGLPESKQARYQYRLEQPPTGDRRLDGAEVYTGGPTPLAPGSVRVRRITRKMQVITETARGRTQHGLAGDRRTTRP